jgi:hypothetical protein
MRRRPAMRHDDVPPEKAVANVVVANAVSIRGVP